MEEEEEYATLPVKEGSNESRATFESKNEDNNEEWVTLPTRDERNNLWMHQMKGEVLLPLAVQTIIKIG